MSTNKQKSKYSRRKFLTNAAGAIGIGALLNPLKVTAAEQDAPVKSRDNLKVTKLETFLVKPRWLFLKIHTNTGIVGLGQFIAMHFTGEDRFSPVH